jgi:general secretion pathway protein C
MTFSSIPRRIAKLAAYPKLQGHARMALTLGLLALLMLLLARWTWLLLPASQDTPNINRPAATSQTALQAAPSVLANIASTRLWGALPVATAPTVTQDTRLPLTLRGILSGQGLAIIETSGNARVYRIGDTLPGGAHLHDVLVDHVLIDRAGVIERLALPRATLAQAPLSSSGPANMPAPPANLGKLLQQSPAELSKSFRLSPVSEGGKLRGYRLRALRDPEVLKNAGLQADDILVSVNGTSLTQANDLPKFIKNLRTATAIDAVVLRNGSEIPLHLNLNAN